MTRLGAARLGVIAAALVAMTAASVAPAASAAPPRHDDAYTVYPDEWDVDPAVGSVFTGWAAYTGRPPSRLGLWSTGSATGHVDLGWATTRLVLEAGADRCGPDGGARASVLVDGEPVLTDVLVDADMGRYWAPGSWGPGRHDVELRFLNDHRAGDCDRNLKVSRVYFAEEWPQASVQMRADSATLVPAGAGTFYRKGPQGEGTHLLWSNGSVTSTVTTQAMEHSRLNVRVAGHDCEGPARMVMRVGGRYVGQQDVGPDAYGQLGSHRRSVPFAVPAGTTDLTIEFVNDHRTGDCDRNLKVGDVWLDEWH
ncbi:carbohydrate-binding domain-containing protein [Thalassiella azotivora]